MPHVYESHILSYLCDHDFLSLRQAREFIPASDVTIRRLFNKLAESNLVRRVRGGVRPPAQCGEQRVPFFLRDQWNAREKRFIARRAAQLAAPHMAVAIHGGTTTTFLGMYIDCGTLIVNSLSICRILAERFPSGGGPAVYLAGGSLDLRSDILTGPEAERSFGRYHADLAFISSFGLDRCGLLDTDPQSASAISKVADIAEKTVCLADHSKFNKKSVARGPAWSRIDVLVTDFFPENHDLLNSIRDCGVEVIIVNCEEEQRRLFRTGKSASGETAPPSAHKCQNSL